MNRVDVRLSKLSICDCGYLVLKGEIGLGTQYTVDVDDQAPGALRCGGCKKINPCTFIFAEQRGSSRGGYIPKEIFEEITIETKVS